MDFDRVRSLPASIKLTDAFLDLFYARVTLENIFSDIVGTDFRTCIPAALSLRQVLDYLTSDDREAEETLETQHPRLLRALDDFEVVFRAELANADAYYVTRKGAFDTKILVEQGAALWSADLTQKVPNSAFDIGEAGRCIAFELGTAAGFHILRATEAVMYAYWKTLNEEGKVLKNRNLGALISSLEQIDQADQKIIAALLQLKDLHRNPLMHPEDTLTVEQAMRLYGVAQSAVDAMLAHIPFPEIDPDDVA